jgi:hypothetical protein
VPEDGGVLEIIMLPMSYAINGPFGHGIGMPSINFTNAGTVRVIGSSVGSSATTFPSFGMIPPPVDQLTMTGIDFGLPWPGMGVYFDSSYPVRSTSLTLDSCTTHGDRRMVPSLGPGLGSGAMILGPGNHHLINCDFRYTWISGGGGSLNISSSHFTGAGTQGGGKGSGTIYAKGATWIPLTVDHSVIENSPGAVGFAGGRMGACSPGGAIYQEGGSTVVTSTTIRNSSNGALVQLGGSAVVANSTFAQNVLACDNDYNPDPLAASNIHATQLHTITIIGTTFDSGNSHIDTTSTCATGPVTCADLQTPWACSGGAVCTDLTKASGGGWYNDSTALGTRCDCPCAARKDYLSCSGPACSGHGNCSAAGTCACETFYQGSNCSTCVAHNCGQIPDGTVVCGETISGCNVCDTCCKPYLNQAQCNTCANECPPTPTPTPVLPAMR